MKKKREFYRQEPGVAARAGKTEGNCCLNIPSVQQYQILLFLACKRISVRM